MWALDFLFLFLLIQLAARVDSSGEHQGSACVIYLPVTIYPLVVEQVREETHGQGSSLLLANLAPFLD